MLIFVDESGDSGYKFDKSSSPLFVVTAIVFLEPADAQACAAAITGLKTQLRFKPSAEFKFNKAGYRHRMDFFKTIAPHTFRYYSFALDKVKISGSDYRHPDTAYKIPLRRLLETIRRDHSITDATIWIDKCGDRKFTQGIRSYLVKRLAYGNSPIPFRELKPVKSHSNVLIQMADMVCGAVACSMTPGRTDRNDYLAVIRRRHEAQCRLWP